MKQRTAAPPPAKSRPPQTRAAQRAASARRARIRTMSIVGSALVLVIVGFVAWLLLHDSNTDSGVAALPGESAWTATNAPGTVVPVSGNGDHTYNVDEHVQYSTDPPSSGRHFFQWARPGPATTTIPDTMLVHNLEHAYVVIDYNCAPGSCPDLADKLNHIAQSYPKVIANPRPDPALPRIALAAWGHTDAFNLYNEARITNFINVWMNNHGAPEWNLAP